MKQTIIPFIAVSIFVAGCSADIDDCETDPPFEETSTDDLLRECVDNVVFDVKLLGTGTVASRGRLAVLWTQLQTMDTQPVPLIGFDVPFDPKQTQVTIPRSAIRVPEDEKLALCQIKCGGLSCSCADPIYTAVVTIAQDVDGNGRLDVREIEEREFGRGYMLLAHSKTEQTIAPPPADQLFSDGVRVGTGAYRFVGNPEDFPAKVERASDGEHLTLNICRGTGCVLPFPKIRIE